MYRGGGRDLFAPFEALAGRAFQCGPEFHQHGAWVRPQVSGKAAAAEDLEHPPVLRQNVRAERDDAGVVGALGQLLEEQRGDAPALPGVCDHERRFGIVRADAVVAAVGDDRVRHAGFCHERAALRVGGRGPASRQVVQVRDRAGEAHPARLGRQPRQKGDEGRLISGPGRPDPDGRAVPQDRVASSVLRCG